MAHSAFIGVLATPTKDTKMEDRSSGLAVCVCFSERVREGFERTESNTESNYALFSPIPGTPQHTQNGPLSRVERGLRK